MMLRNTCSIKKYGAWIVSVPLGLLLAGGLTYAGNAVWHGTDWEQTNKIVTPKEIADNLEYLNQKIAGLEQNIGGSTTKNGLQAVDAKFSRHKDYVFNFGKAGTDWNVIRLERFYQEYTYKRYGTTYEKHYNGSGFITHNNGKINIYILYYNNTDIYAQNFTINNLGTSEECLEGGAWGNTFNILCFWQDYQGNLKVRIRGSRPTYNWNTDYGLAAFFVFK